MNTIQNPRLTPNARKLRKDMTEEERKLWYTFLKTLPFTVHRQKVIKRYIVDFYIAEAKIVIELDGSQHYEEKSEQADEERDLVLKELGLTVLRYTNLDIQRKFKTVCEDIWNHIEGVVSTSSVSLCSTPSPQGEGKGRF